MLSIETDIDKCIGAGLCVVAAPRYFDQRDEDGKVLVLEGTPGADDRAVVDRAIELCPAAVIRLSQQ
jgi:ferredoxin